MKWQHCSITCRKTLFVDMETNQAQGERFILMPKQRYEHRKVDPMRPLLPPERLWLSIDAVNHALKIIPKLILKQKKCGHLFVRKNLAVSALPAVTIQSQQKEPLSQLRQFIEHFKGKCFIFS